MVKKKKEMLDMSEEIVERGEKFELLSIAWKKAEMLWTIVMTVTAKMDEALSKYTVKVSFDETPHLEKIQNLKMHVEENQRELKLFPDDTKDVTKRINSEIAKAEKYLNERKDNCPGWEFEAVVASIDWSKGAPKVKFYVTNEVVEWLNKHKSHMNEYVIILKPEVKPEIN